MVIINRVTSHKPDEHIPDYDYSLLPIHFEDPKEEPTTEASSARAYEFDNDGKPSAYATACPSCGQGNFPTIDQIVEHEGNYFAACSECRAGAPPEEAEFDDPFQNPIKDNKIAAADMDPDLDSSVVDTTQTVAEKMAAAGVSVATEEPSEPQKAEDTVEGQDAGEEEEDASVPDGDEVLANLDPEAEKLLNMLGQEDDEV